MVGGERRRRGVGTVEIQAMAEDRVDTDTWEILDARDRSHEIWIFEKDSRLNEAQTLLAKTTDSVTTRDETSNELAIQQGNRESVLM
jgi:hypothetical protein